MPTGILVLTFWAIYAIQRAGRVAELSDVAQLATLAVCGSLVLGHRANLARRRTFAVTGRFHEMPR
jgi:hypothetical protein